MEESGDALLDKPSSDHGEETVPDLTEDADESSNMETEHMENLEDSIKEPLSVDTSETVSVDGERLRSNSSSASSPAKGSSGSTTPTGKSTPPLTPSPSSPSNKPTEGGTEAKPAAAQSLTAKFSGKRKHNRPSRAGITWRVNAKIEALDFQKKWYSARIVDLDDTDNTVLVHFDGWNQRYDEWMDMSSERIRPSPRHSDRRKEAAKLKAHLQEHRLGDNVFAKWTDCRMYAGTIVGVNSNGSYEVLFYDGFKKAVQPINVKAMSMEVQKEYAVAGILPDPTKRVREKLQMVSRIEREPSQDAKRSSSGAHVSTGKTKQDEQKTDGKGSASAGPSDQPAPHSSKEKTPPGLSKDLSDKIKRTIKRKSLESTPTSTSVHGSPKLKKGKILIGGSFQLKRMKAHTGKPVILKKHEARSDMIRKKQSQFLKGQKKPGQQRSEGRSVPKVKGSSRKPHPKVASPGDDTSDEDIVLAQLIDPKTPGPETPWRPQQTLAAKKAFKVEAEHNKCKCPFDNCNKSFRKMSLVEYHIKYYHTEDGAQPPHIKRRRKTLSVCSSDSEMSGSRGTFPPPSMRRNRDMSNTSLELPSDSSRLSTLEDVMLHDLSEVETLHTTTTEEHDTRDAQVLGDESRVAGEEGMEGMDDSAMDRLSKDELVNCICQINEENGLMIQCDVCLCWQHAVCMELTEEGLPSKYICYVCANPPGVRDRGRYSYDQDWLKQGTIARFGFLPPDPFASQKAQIMQATHSLVADIHNIKAALHSTKCQIHAVRDKNDSEVKFWSKNWDKLKAEKLAKEAEEQHKLEVLNQDADHPQVKQEQLNIEGIKSDILLPLNTEIKTEPDSGDTHSSSLAETPQAEEKSRSVFGPTHSTPQESHATSDLTTQSQICLRANESSSSLSSLRSTGSDDCFPRTATPSGLTSLTEEVDPILPKPEEPKVSCERNLLEHVSGVQDNMDCQLELLEEQISALEAADDNGSSHSTGDVLRDLPRLKKAIHQILNDLIKVKHMALYH